VARAVSENWVPRRNAAPLPIAATIAVETSGPKPVIWRSRRQRSSSVPMRSISSVTGSMSISVCFHSCHSRSLQGTNLLCGDTGNCQLFVFRKANDKSVSLFGGDQAPLAESFQLGPIFTRGIKGLTVVTNTSADSTARKLQV
jgi:hypothetical protein